jgi:hypothetical protein
MLGNPDGGLTGDGGISKSRSEWVLTSSPTGTVRCLESDECRGLGRPSAWPFCISCGGVLAEDSSISIPVWMFLLLAFWVDGG